MEVVKNGDKILVKDIKDFDIAQTLLCGQCFHFDELNDNKFGVVAYSTYCIVSQKGSDLIFEKSSLNEVKNIWIPYFDLERDYAFIKKYLLEKDDKLKTAIDEKWGIRLLNQEFHEILLSFIISQNKQIPHIKKIVKDISEKYGEYLGEYEDVKFYAFPEIEDLNKITVKDYRELKTGFRAPYLKDASDKLNDGSIDFNILRSIGYDKAIEKLTDIKGVGLKVANCVSLFSLGYRNSFPIDVWIKRIMEHVYFNDMDVSKEEIAKLADKLYGNFGGYAQQYLFSYGKDMNIGKDVK